MIDWLSRNAFGQSLNTTKMRQGFDAGDYSVPDIITSRGMNAKSEYYEIKPDSDSGKADGFRKLVDFARLNFDFHLLFFPGEDYDPTTPTLLRASHVIGATEYELELKWWRQAPGLILYEICYKVKQRVEVKQQAPIAEIALMCLLALLLVWLLRGFRGNPGGLGAPLPSA